MTMTRQETAVQLQGLARERESAEALLARYESDLEDATGRDDTVEIARLAGDIKSCKTTLRAVDKQLGLLSGKAEPKKVVRAEKTEETKQTAQAVKR